MNNTTDYFICLAVRHIQISRTCPSKKTAVLADWTAARSVRARMDGNVVLPERDIELNVGAVGDDSMSSNDSVDNMLNLLAPADSSVNDSILESDVNRKEDRE